MNIPYQKSTVLLVDDDPEDRMLIREAFREMNAADQLRMLASSEELLDYLRNASSKGNQNSDPLPRLILLDLNMPRKDGRQLLKELKSDPRFRKIPVVVLSTSQSPEDVTLSYDSGANSFVTKPGEFARLVEVVHQLRTYWFDTVQLPVAERT